MDFPGFSRARAVGGACGGSGGGGGGEGGRNYNEWRGRIKRGGKRGGSGERGGSEGGGKKVGCALALCGDC